MAIKRASAAAALLLSACGPVNQGLETTHQPIVTERGAYVPGCPDWSYGGAREDLQEGTSSNYGCAASTNLAAMIADPRDLLVGKSSSATGHDPAQANRAVDRWRDVFWKPFGWEEAYGKTAGSAPAPAAPGAPK